MVRVVRNMVILQKKAPITFALPATVAATTQGPPPPRLEPMVTVEAILSQGAPTPLPEALNPESADPGAT